MDKALNILLLITPLILFTLAAFILAARFRQRTPGPAKLVVGAGIVAVLNIGFIVFNQTILLDLALDATHQFWIYNLIMNLVYTVLFLSMTGLLLAATFSQRAPQPEPAPTPVTTADSLPHRGPMVLTFGLLGLLLFAPLGVVAWVLGGKDLKAMQRGNMDTQGRGMTQAGMILGIVATAFMVIALVLLIGILMAL